MIDRRYSVAEVTDVGGAAFLGSSATGWMTCWATRSVTASLSRASRSAFERIATDAVFLDLGNDSYRIASLAAFKRRLEPTVAASHAGDNTCAIVHQHQPRSSQVALLGGTSDEDLEPTRRHCTRCSSRSVRSGSRRQCATTGSPRRGASDADQSRQLPISASGSLGPYKRTIATEITCRPIHSQAPAMHGEYAAAISRIRRLRHPGEVKIRKSWCADFSAHRSDA